jgi:hypothetical protein
VETQMRDLLSLHIAKPRLMKPRNELSRYMGFGVSIPGELKGMNPSSSGMRNPER